MTQLTRFTPSAFNKSLAKSFVGFDSFFDDLERRLSTELSGNYPPYNIVKLDDDNYKISLAVTGFEKEDVTVSLEGNELQIKCVSNDDSKSEVEYLHHGLALRNFERTFTLAEHMEVKSAEIKNGVLSITIQRVIPEDKKPRIIEVE